MGILGIENRTENWKTAKYFSPLVKNEDARLRLVERLLGEPPGCSAGEIRIELFWRGMRDYLHKARKEEKDPEAFARSYRDLFPDLRSRVEEFTKRASRRFRKLKDWNYDVSEPGWIENLGNNLVNTEIDIVVDSPRHLFIGEAKHAMSFHASSALVLTHQLIRQYVMARLLLDRLGCEKAVVPFVVGDDSDKMRKPNQVKFMIWKGWLDERNVLEWDDISSLYV